MGAKKQQAGGLSEEKANEIINRALESQEESRKRLEARTGTYETKRETSQSELDKLFGRSGAQAMQNWEQYFAQGIPALTSIYEAKQKREPGILGSQSYGQLTESLRGSAQEFTGGMNQASNLAASRLYQALAAPAAGFEAIANNPAFNKLQDPTFMELAKKPPTVQSDVNSFKQLYTYNV